MAEKLFSDPVITRWDPDPQVFSGAVEALKTEGANDWGTVFERAVRGDLNADWVLCAKAVELLLGTNHPLWIYAASKLQEHLFGRAPGKGSPHKNAKRDLFIVWAVKRLTGPGLLKPTRSNKRRTDTPHSACSFVKKLLAKHGINIAESTVETVWTDSVLN